MALPLAAATLCTGVAGGLSVSLPFNAVSIVAVGIFSVRSRRFACFLASCAFLVCLISAGQQGRIYVESAGSSGTLARVTEPGARRYLVLGLGRWISTALYSAWVARAFFRHLPRLRVGFYPCILFCALEVYNQRVNSPETEAIYTISGDKCVWFYFHGSQLAESFRATMQVTFILSRAIIGEQNAILDQKVHTLIYSALILVYDILSSYWSGFNPYFLDIALQILLILYVCGCPIQNGRREEHVMPALNEAPPVQPQPHWAQEQGEDGAVWRDDDIPVLAQEEAVILDFNGGPDVWPLGFPGLEEWLQEPPQPPGLGEWLEEPLQPVDLDEHLGWFDEDHYGYVDLYQDYRPSPVLAWPYDDRVPELPSDDTAWNLGYVDLNDTERVLSTFEAVPQADRQETVGQLVVSAIQLPVPTVI